MSYQERYPAVLRYLCSFIDMFLVAGGIIVLTLIFTNAVLRGAAGFDLAWSLEVTAFLLLWLTFLGCSAATARGAHMRVTEIVTHFVPEKGQAVLNLTISILVAFLVGSLIYQGANISLHTWDQKTTVLYWPVGLFYASLPVGMSITLIFHLYNFSLDLRDSVKIVSGAITKSDDTDQEGRK